MGDTLKPASDDLMFTGDTPLPYKNTSFSSPKKQNTDINSISKQAEQGRAIPGTTESPYTSRGIPDHAKFLLRTAGRCTHARCNAIRNRGVDLMKSSGTHINMNQMQAPIPSVASYQKTYPIVNGKQDRQNPEIVQTLKPKDPKHPEWVEAENQSHAADSIFSPHDLLEHHHGPEDHDFEKYPLPWKV